MNETMMAVVSPTSPAVFPSIVARYFELVLAWGYGRPGGPYFESVIALNVFG